MTLVCYTCSAKQSQKYTHTTCFLSVNPLSTPSLSPAHTQGHTRCAVVDNSYQQWPQSTQAEQYLLIYRPFLFNALSLHTHSHLNMNVLVSVGETFMWCLFCSSVTIWRWRHTFKRGVWQKTHFSLLCGCSSGAELWPCDVTTCPIFPSPLWLSWKGDKGSELPVYYIAKKKQKTLNFVLNLLILIGSIYYYALMSREFYILCKKLKSCSQEQDLNHLNAYVCPCSVTLYYCMMIQMMTSDTLFFVSSRKWLW